MITEKANLMICDHGSIIKHHYQAIHAQGAGRALQRID
jgi:hypothetical protein